MSVSNADAPGSTSHSTGANDFRQCIFDLATETLQAHSDDIQNNHKWLDSFLESVRITAQPRQREHSRTDIAEIMKTPGRRRVGLTPSHNNTSRASPSKLAAKDPVATLLFGNPRRPSPGLSFLSNGKENAVTPPIASPSPVRRPFGTANNKSVFSPIRSGLPTPSARTTAHSPLTKPPPPVKDAVVLSPPRPVPPRPVSAVDQHSVVEPPPVVVVEPEPEPEEEEDGEESEENSIQENVGDLSNVMEEDEEQAPVDHDSDTDDDLAVQEELVGQASFEVVDDEKANLSIIGEEEEEDDVFAAKPSARQATSPAPLAHSSSLVVEETQGSTVPETQFSPVRPPRSPARAAPSPAVAPVAVAVGSSAPAPEQAAVPALVSQDPPTPRHSTSSTVTVAEEADADTAVPLNDGPSSLRNAIPSAPSSASSTRTPASSTRFGAGTYSSAKAGLGISIGSSPPFAHHPITATTTTPGFGLGRPSTGGTARAPLNFVGLPKKSLPFALGRGLAGHQSWSSSVADSQGSSQPSSQPSQPSTQATSVATALSTTNSLVNVAAPVPTAGVKRKSLNAPDVPNKAAKLAADSIADDNTEGSKTRRDLLNRMQAMNNSRVSGVARPSAIGFSLAPVVAPKSLGPAASAPALHTTALPTPARTPVEPTFAPSKLPVAAASLPSLHGSVVPAGPAPIPPINTNFLSPAKPSASSRNVPTRASPGGQSYLPTLTRRTSVKDVVKSFERNTVADAAPPSPSKPPPANSQLFRSPSSLFSPTSPGRRPVPSAIARPTSPLLPLSPRPARIPTAPTLPTSPVQPPAAVHRMTLRSPSPAKVPPTPPPRLAFSIVIPAPSSASKGKKPALAPVVVPPTPPCREPEMRETTTPQFSPPREPFVLGRNVVPMRQRELEPETEIEDHDDEDDEDDMYGQEEAEPEEEEEPVLTLREVVPVPTRRASSPFSSSDESDDDSDEEDESALYPLPAHPDAGNDDDDSYGSDGDDEDSIVIVEPGRGALAGAFDDTRMEVDTFTYTSVKTTQPFKPAPPPGAVRANVIRPSPNKVVMPGSFDGEDDSDEDVAGGLLLNKATASSSTNGRTLHTQSSVASLGGQSSSQGGGSQRSVSQQSQNAPGAFSFLNRPFGGGPGTAPRKGDAPKAVKSIQLAAAAAKKEKEERERKAALKEETQRKRLALMQKKQDEDRTKAEEERRARVDGAEKKRKERDDAAQKAKVNRSAVKPKVQNDRATDDEPSKKRKVEPEPKRSEVKKVQQPYRPFPTPSNHLNSSLASSIGRTGMAGPSNPLKSSQNGGGGLKASASGSNSNNPSSMIGVKYLNPKMFQSSVGGTSASASASLAPPRPQARLPDPEPAIELPDIDSEYSDSGDEQHFEKVASYPQWVQSPAGLLARQQYTNPDDLFGPMPPLSMKEIFKTNTSKFSKRSSSAHWDGVDRLTESEMSKYSRIMGYTTSNAAGGSGSGQPPN